MDIILEFFDAYVFDRLYATLLPAASASTAGVGLHVQNATTATLSSIRESGSLLAASQKTAAAAAAAAAAFEPASRLISFPTTEWTYASSVPRDNAIRQFVGLFLITWVFGVVLYFVFATASYLFVFDHGTFKHPKYLKNQIAMEIRQAMGSMPGMSVLTALCFTAEVRGYAKLYDLPSEAPFWLYNVLQFPVFILFTDCLIYFIHRGLHHPRVYKTLHKPHHKWIMPTPFASHAFHPLDGFAQSIPYHLFPFVLPLQKLAYIALFAFINIWTIIIHDGEYMAQGPIINGAACHTMHHLYFNYNYGQFTTLWDRLGGSYRKPNDELFNRETKMGTKEWQRQKEEMEKIVKQVEGGDDRTYLDSATAERQKKTD